MSHEPLTCVNGMTMTWGDLQRRWMARRTANLCVHVDTMVSLCILGRLPFLGHVARRPPMTRRVSANGPVATGPSLGTEPAPVAAPGADRWRLVRRRGRNRGPLRPWKRTCCDWSVAGDGTAARCGSRSGPVATGPSPGTEPAPVAALGADLWRLVRRRGRNRGPVAAPGADLWPSLAPTPPDRSARPPLPRRHPGCCR